MSKSQNIIKLTFLLLIFSSSAYTQSTDIYWGYPKDGSCNPVSSNTQYTRDVDFATAMVGYSGGTGGKVYKTTNNSTWNVIYTFESEVQKITFKNVNEGAVLLSNDKIYITTNGGLTWVDKGNQSGNIHDIYYSSNYLIAVGWNYIHRLSSANQSFEQKANIGSSVLYDVFTLESNNLYSWAGGQSGRLYRSINGGNTWSQMTTSPTGSTIRSIFFIDIQNGWLGTDTELWRTTNGGSTWTFVSTSGKVDDVKFIDTNIGYYTLNGGLYRTFNGGITSTEISEVRAKNNAPNSFTVLGTIRDIDLIVDSGIEKIWGSDYSHGIIVHVEY